MTPHRPPRPAARRIRTYHEVEEPAGQSILAQVESQRARVAARLAGVARIVAVASGKGGVGKSAVAANVAAALAAGGRSVGALDADLNGPSLGRMLGADAAPLRSGERGVEPANGAAGVRLISMDLLLPADDSPLRWKGPATDSFAWRGSIEAGALREFVADVAWGDLDILLLDVPPGTDRMERVLELLGARLDAVVLVTTPSEMARSVVARSARLLREARVRDAGLVVNMSGRTCPSCGHASPLYTDDGGRRLADESGLDIWAELPFDPRLAAATDAGRPFVLEEPDAPAARALITLASRIAAAPGAESSPAPDPAPRGP